MRFCKSASAFFAAELDRPEAVVRYIDAHREEFGVEPICRVLQFAPSTYYAAKSRPLSPRAVSDGLLGEHIRRIHEQNYAVYGVRKVWRQLRRDGETAGRDQVGRVMKDLGLQGVRRGKAKRTTVSGDVASRPGDLVDRHFFAVAPNRLWLADITYVCDLVRLLLHQLHHRRLRSAHRRLEGVQVAPHRPGA